MCPIEIVVIINASLHDHILQKRGTDVWCCDDMKMCHAVWMKLTGVFHGCHGTSFWAAARALAELRAVGSLHALCCVRWFVGRKLQMTLTTNHF